MKKILITEDSSFQRRNIKKILHNAGYYTEEAENGQRAIIKLQRYQPDVILVDLLMPEMNGLELLAVLREQYQHIPVIVVTSDIQESTSQQCTNLGAKAVINKPIDDKILLETIEQVTQ